MSGNRRQDVDKIMEAMSRTQDNINRSEGSGHTQKMSLRDKQRLELKNERREQSLEGYRRALDREWNR
jgi:small acid-soluble spore protein (thioredoxin-like protein)